MTVKSLLEQINEYDIEIVFDSRDSVKKKLLNGSPNIIYFTPVEGKESKKYKNSNNSKEYISNYSAIHFPDLTLDELIDTYKCDGGNLYEEIALEITPYIDCGVSFESLFVIYLFLHEVGHWKDFIRMDKNVYTFINEDRGLYEANFNEMTNLYKERVNRLKKGISCKLTAKEKNKLTRLKNEYRQIPKEQRADKFARCEIKSLISKNKLKNL